MKWNPKVVLRASFFTQTNYISMPLTAFETMLQVFLEQ